MRTNESTSGHGVQRLFYLALFASLLAVAILGSSCNGDKKMQIHGIGETPIVITGGSIQLDIPKGFSGPPSGPWVYSGNAIGSCKIYNNNPNPAFPLTDVDVGGGNCQIVIERFDTSYKSVITVTSDDTSNPKTVTVAVGSGELTKRPGPSNQWFNPSSQITQVTSTPKGKDPIQYNVGKGLPPNGKLTIEMTAKY